MKAVPFALLLATLPAAAQECPAASPLGAGVGGPEAPLLVAARPVMLSLKPAPDVHFSAAARRAADAKAFGGIAAFTVPAAGTWRVSLGSGAWIAVVQQGVEVRSTAHSHGETCFTKMVDFPLQPGKALIEISASDDAAIRLMAAPAG